MSYYTGSIVRSKTVALLKEQGLTVLENLLTRSSKEFRLIQRIRRELDEFVRISANPLPNAQKCTLNAANLIDLIYALAHHSGINKGEINAIRKALRKTEGTFEHGSFIASVTYLTEEERKKQEEGEAHAASLAEKARSTRGGASALIEAGLVNTELVPKSTNWDMSDSLADLDFESDDNE